LSIVALLVIAVAVWWRLSTPARPGIVLITIDTLRADRVGAYGSKIVRTPALDSIAAQGIRFNAAYATVPLTLPSHLSILSGRLPVEHSVRTNDGYRVPDDVPLVAETLRRTGYRTAAFVGSVVLRSSTGIGRGFDLFDDDMGQRAERPGGEVVQRAIEWLGSVGRDRFFIWVHLNDPHLPYDAPEPFATEYSAHPYEAEVAYADHCVGTLLAELARLGMLKRTTVIVAADHGEGLGDHGERSHGVLLYDSTIHVPLLIRPAGGAPSPSTVEQIVSTAQIEPTVLALAHLPNDSVFPGLLKAGPTAGLVSAETLYLAQQLGWSPMYAAHLGHFKVIDAPTPELYDLDADPGEQRNLAAVHPEMVKDLREKLRHDLETAAGRAVKSSTVSLDSNARSQLATLGYASGGGRIAVGFVPVVGIDPKERIDLWEQIEHGLELSQSSNHAKARAVFESVLQQDPGNVLALKFLGAAALERGDLAQAIEYNQRVVATGLHQADALSNLALAYYRAGRLDAALTAAHAAIHANASHPMARTNLLLILQAIGSERARADNTAGAIAAFEEAASIDPTNLDITERLAAVLHRAGRVDEARRMFESVVAMAPNRPEPQLSLAVLDVEAGRLHDAVDRLERIGRDWPGAYQAQFYLGEAYRGLGDRVRARNAYMVCLGGAPPTDPIVPAVRHALALLK